MNTFSFVIHMFSQPFVFLYLGPETIMPLGSAIAAVIGFLLIGWRWIAALIRKISGKTETSETPDDPAAESPTEEVPN